MKQDCGVTNRMTLCARVHLYWYLEVTRYLKGWAGYPSARYLTTRHPPNWETPLTTKPSVEADCARLRGIIPFSSLLLLVYAHGGRRLLYWVEVLRVGQGSQGGAGAHAARETKTEKACDALGTN